MAQILVSHTREVLSNVCGSLSIACWVILLLPQLLEQWRLKSADGVSLGFIMIWLFGDLTNLIGSFLGHLRPSVALLALWFCFSDTLLVVSYCYYKRLATVKSQINHSPRSGVPSPLGSAAASTIDVEHRGLPYNLPDVNTPLLHEDNFIPTSPITKNAANRGNWLLSTGIPSIFVIVVATLSYFISDSAGGSDSDVPPGSKAELLGYVSAVLYLAARIPQIIQNHRRRSVEGLSMGFFALSIVGNLTYAGQVIIYRTDRDWLIEYLPWLSGSLGTILEDFVILAQFHIYKRLE